MIVTRCREIVQFPTPPLSTDFDTGHGMKKSFITIISDVTTKETPLYSVYNTSLTFNEVILSEHITYS